MRYWWERFKAMRHEHSIRVLTRQTIRDMDNLKRTLR